MRHALILVVILLGLTPLSAGAQGTDTTAPTVTCAPSDGLWHANDVSIQCTASDAESGLANPADASFQLTTNVVPGTHTGNAFTDSRPVCDIATNCATAGPVGANKIDKRTPSNPSTIRSSSHKPGQWKSARRIAMTFSNASDAGGSGIDGFSFRWTHAAGTVPDTVKDREQAARSATSPALANGRWYFHLRTRDNVGNWSGTAHRGPFLIDGTPPRVRAHSTSGKINHRIRLRYRTGDAPSGKTRERIRVTRGGSLIASFNRGMANANYNNLQSVYWTPRSTGMFRFCVQAFDPAGNSRSSCASVDVTRPAPAPSRCDSSYPTVCIPSPPPDLDCGDVPYTDFVVRQPDPHGFDGDYDGRGCES